MIKTQRGRYILLLAASSVALFFVGREAASWRPHWVSKGGLKAVYQHRDKAGVAHLRMRPSEIMAVSPDRKSVARGLKLSGSRDDFRFNIRNTTNGNRPVNIDYDQGRPDEVQFSPSGRFLIIRFYAYITMCFDARSGKRLWTRPATQVLFSADEKTVVCARQITGRHGDGGVIVWTIFPRTGHKIRGILAKNQQTLLPLWFDGPNHIHFGDSKDNLWRVRVR